MSLLAKEKENASVDQEIAWQRARGDNNLMGPGNIEYNSTPYSASRWTLEIWQRCGGLCLQIFVDADNRHNEFFYLSNVHVLTF